MTRIRHSSAVLWTLLAAALFMRAFLPQGYMPARAGDGTITVRVCGSGHVVQIPTDKRETPRGAERVEPPCAFAGLGTPLLPSPAVADLPTLEPIEVLFGEAAETAFQLIAALPHPPARGPPRAA